MDFESRLPLPVATLVRLSRNSKSPKEGHDTAFYAWEVSVHLGVAACPPEDKSDLARGSLGQWVGALRASDERLDSPSVLDAAALFADMGAGSPPRPSSVSPRRLLSALVDY